jgi:hypothetical protein
MFPPDEELGIRQRLGPSSRLAFGRLLVLDRPAFGLPLLHLGRVRPERLVACTTVASLIEREDVERGRGGGEVAEEVVIPRCVLREAWCEFEFSGLKR